MYTREVKIEEYWPLIVRNTDEFGQIAVAENPEFNQLARCLYDALKDAFIIDATEYGVQRWEKMLGLVVTDDMPLDDRKAAILTRLSIKLPYTWRVLKQLIEDVVGADKLVLEYVNDECKLVVHTDRISDEKSQVVADLIERVVPMNLAVERYNHTLEISWREINKYAACKTYEDVVAVNPDYKNDLTADGEWVYPMPEMTRFDNKPNSDWWSGFFHKSPIKKIKAVFPKCTYSHAFLTGASNIEEADLEFPIATRVSAPARSLYKLKKLRIVAPLATASDTAFYWNQCRNQDWYIYYPKTKNMQSMFADGWYIEEIKGEFGMEATNLNYAYKKCPMLRVFPTNYPQAQTADAMFNECQIPGEAAIAVLNSFPAYTSGTHNVTMGIHVDYQNDPAVLAALDNATAKGWTVTRQWNGTPTSGVSTTDLEEIYCKVTESEYGDYTDENGNRCMLDWGHQITSPDGKTPSELGYKLFFSIYDAEKYYKLSKIEGVENE